MSDLISRQAVDDVIYDYSRTVALDYAKIMARINKLPSVENKGEWIPVSERLPEKNMRCLVAVGFFNLTQIAIYSDLMGITDHRIFYQGEVGYDSFLDITEYVKAWQPLPEPYKAESEE